MSDPRDRPTHRPVVVVTGSTRGIGLGLARELGRRGCDVVVSGRDRDRVDAAVSRLVADGVPKGHVVGEVVDVTDADSVAALWEHADYAFGRVDHWVNNAGSTAAPVPLHEVPVDHLERVVATNLTGLLLCCRVAAAGMQKQAPVGGASGWIWNVEGPGSGGEVQQGLATYGTTKAGVGYLMKALRKDLAGTGVKVGAIRPGITVTEQLLAQRDVVPPERWERTRRTANLLGDLPETSTPWLAEQLLAATRDGTRIQWLPPTKVAWRLATGWRSRRDLLAELERREPVG